MAKQITSQKSNEVLHGLLFHSFFAAGDRTYHEGVYTQVDAILQQDKAGETFMYKGKHQGVEFVRWATLCGIPKNRLLTRKLVKLLFEHGTNPNAHNEEGTLGHHALKYRFLDLCSDMVAFGLDPNIPDRDKYNLGHMILSPRRYGGEFCEVSESLLQSFIQAGLKPNARNRYGFTLGHCAARHLDDYYFPWVLESLLKAGLRLEVKDGSGNKALDYRDERLR